VRIKMLFFPDAHARMHDPAMHVQLAEHQVARGGWPDDVGVHAHLPCSTRIHNDLSTSAPRPGSVLFLIEYFTTSISFIYLLYMPWLLFQSLPLDMLVGLAMPTRRSPDLRAPIFYLALCSPPPRHARGLGLANLWVARLVGFYFSYECSFFNCLTLVVKIR
jgi:hypothetical protein